MFPIQHSHLHPTFPIPNMNLPILRTCRQEWKTGHAICIGEASRENEVHNLFCQRIVGKSMPHLHSLTFKIPKVSPGHLQKITRVYTLVLKKSRFISLHCRDSTMQHSAILAKGLTAMVTQQKRRVDTIQLRRKDPCQLAPMCERPKAGCESHCSHKFSVQTQTQTNISLGRQRIKSKVSPLKVTRFQCTMPNTRSFTGDVNSPHCYNRTGFSF